MVPIAEPGRLRLLFTFQTLRPPKPVRSLQLGYLAVFFTVFLLVASGLQRLTGAAHAAFGLYPDEPSHYVSCVLIRDYLRSGFHQSPLAFAAQYYKYLPFFAIGYWPPAFYAIGALWMFVFGASHGSALLLSAVVAAAIATTVAQVACRWAGPMGGLLWGAVFLVIPQVVDSSSMFMVDLPVTLFSFWALLALLRFYRAPDRPGPAVLFGVFAALTILTKYSGAFVCLLPLVLLIGSRNSRLVLKPFFWVQPLIVVLLCGPWIFFTHKLMAVGLPQGGDPVHKEALPFLPFFEGLVNVFGTTLTLVGLLAIALLFAWRRWTVDLLLYAAAPLCVIVFLLLTPVGVEFRYLLPAIPPFLLFLSRVGAMIAKKSSLPARPWVAAGVPAVVLLYTVLRCVVTFPHYPVNHVAAVVEAVKSHPQWTHVSILLPSTSEGPLVAEFASRETASQPTHVLLRPTKTLSEADWYGVHRLDYTTPEQLQKALQEQAVDLVLIDHGTAMLPPELDRLIRNTVHEFPGYWRTVVQLPSGWDIYASPTAETPHTPRLPSKSGAVQESARLFVSNLSNTNARTSR